MRPVNTEPVKQVSGPSFLGLADEPSSSVSYLLEDELTESHWGRSVVLLLILIGIGVAGWHWRDPLRTYVAARLAQRPNNQSEQVNPPEAASAAPGTEAGAGVPAGASVPVDKPMTGVGDLPPGQAGQNPAAPASQNVPATAQNAGAPGSQSSGTAPGANAQPDGPAPPAAAATPAQASAAPESQPAAATQEKATEQTTAAETPVPASAVTKHMKSKPTPSTAADADQLEAQGEKYLYGSGGSASCGRAQADLQAAAEQGNAKADSVLGTMYATGHCVNRDLPLAYRWFAKALQQDPANARLQRDLQVLWNQMTAAERQIAMRH